MIGNVAAIIDNNISLVILLIIRYDKTQVPIKNRKGSSFKKRASLLIIDQKCKRIVNPPGSRL